MVDPNDNDVSIEHISNYSIVSLKISGKSLDNVKDCLQIVSPLRATDGDPRSIWLGPGHWSLGSDTDTSDIIVGHCRVSLVDIVYNAIDYSAGLAQLRISGAGVREVLATGCGLDFRSEQFTIGTCCRTRLAQIAAIIVAERYQQLEIYMDRSYDAYLSAWLADPINIAAHAVATRSGRALQ